VRSSAPAVIAAKLARCPSNAATVSDRTKLTPPLPRTRRDPFSTSFQMKRITKMSDAFGELCLALNCPVPDAYLPAA
jgi:hypothetical protein